MYLYPLIHNLLHYSNSQILYMFTRGKLIQDFHFSFKYHKVHFYFKGAEQIDRRARKTTFFFYFNGFMKNRIFFLCKTTKKCENCELFFVWNDKNWYLVCLLGVETESLTELEIHTYMHYFSTFSILKSTLNHWRKNFGYRI